MVDLRSEMGDSPVQVNKMPCNFSKNILKSLVGLERAENALKSISMAAIPTQGGKKLFSLDCKLLKS